MNQNLQHILASSQSLWPELMFIGLTLTLLIFGSFKTDPHKGYLVYTTFAILVYFASLFFVKENTSAFFEMLINDPKALFFKKLIAGSGLLFMLHIYVSKKDYRSEFYMLIMFMLTGMYFLCMVQHFMVFYVSIELVSLSAYVLVAFSKKQKAFEASIKYLIFGATSSAIMLYALSFMYGLNHSLYFKDLALIAQEYKVLATVLQFVLFSGLLFKLSAAPFHLWVKEVYQTAPVSLLAFLSFAPKAASILVMYRLVTYLPFDSTYSIGTLILISVFIGNLSALAQSNARLLLAFSGVAHAGFLMIALLEPNYEALKIYVSAYLFMTMGVFMFLQLLEDTAPNLELNTLKGWGKQNTGLLGAATVIFIALIGLPPTIGFTAKLSVFSSAWQAYNQSDNSFIILIIALGLLNAAISIYYYLRVPYFGLVKEPNTEFKKPSNAASIVLYGYAALTLGLFLFWG